MRQTQEQRHVYYDDELKIEAYNLTGIVQKFPNHFHDYYVIGFIEGGRRHLWCRNQEYDLSTGDLILFNPRDNHFCAPIDGEILDYRAVNIDEDVMKRAAREITGREYTPHFTQNVVFQSDITSALGDLYSGIVERASKLEREEAFYFLLEQVLREYGSSFEEEPPQETDEGVRTVCAYLDGHYMENISLSELVGLTNLSKSHLLYLFTKQIGVSPYRYLQSLRIEKSKRLLEEGVPPIDAADRTGFADQSHFSRFFKEFIGLTPKQYQKIFKDAKEEQKDAGN